MKILNFKTSIYVVSGIMAVAIFVVLAQWSQQHAEFIQSLTTQAGWLAGGNFVYWNNDGVDCLCTTRDRIPVARGRQ